MGCVLDNGGSINFGIVRLYPAAMTNKCAPELSDEIVPGSRLYQDVEVPNSAMAAALGCGQAYTQRKRQALEKTGVAEGNRTTQHALAQCWQEKTQGFDDAIWRAPSKTRRIFRN
jgi:hypothetical protein